MSAFAPTRGPDHGYPLLRRFPLVSLLALGTASVVSAVLMSRFLEAQLLRDDAELSRDSPTAWTAACWGRATRR